MPGCHMFSLLHLLLLLLYSYCLLRGWVCWLRLRPVRNSIASSAPIPAPSGLLGPRSCDPAGDVLCMLWSLTSESSIDPRSMLSCLRREEKTKQNEQTIMFCSCFTCSSYTIECLR